MMTWAWAGVVGEGHPCLLLTCDQQIVSHRRTSLMTDTDKTASEHTELYTDPSDSGSSNGLCPRASLLKGPRSGRAPQVREKSVNTWESKMQEADGFI